MSCSPNLTNALMLSTRAPQVCLWQLWFQAIALPVLSPPQPFRPHWSGLHLRGAPWAGGGGSCASAYRGLLGEGPGARKRPARGPWRQGSVFWDQHSAYCREPCRASEESDLINFLHELEPNPIEIRLEQEPAGCLGLWAAAPGAGGADREPGEAGPRLTSGRAASGQHVVAETPVGLCS